MAALLAPVIVLQGALIAVAATNASPAAADDAYVAVSAFGSGPGTGDSEFNQPNGVAIGANGDVYVTDNQNNRVQRFSADGHWIATWGASGTGPGEFESPRGIATDADGNVYVADVINNRVQKFTSTGSFVTEWGGAGSGNGQFNGPLDVAVDASSNVYVADRFNDRIQVFDANGAWIMVWAAPGALSVAVARDGSILVATGTDRRIHVYDTAGNQIDEWTSELDPTGAFAASTDVAVDPDSGAVFVAELSNNRIQKLDASGARLASWGSSGSGPGQLSAPLGLAITSSGHVLVADVLNHRVQEFAPPVVQFELTVSASGTGTGAVSSAPAGIDCGATCSTPFDAGTQVTLTATPDSASSFTGWSGDCTGTDECVVTMDSARSVTATFDTVPNSQLIVHRAGTGSGSVVSQPAGIDCGATCSAALPSNSSVVLHAIAADGSYFVGWSGACSGASDCSVAMDVDRSVTATFDALPGADGDAQVVDIFGAFGNGPGLLQYPWDVAADTSGNVFVVEQSGHRVDVFDNTGEYVRSWGQQGSGPGEFSSPLSVAVDVAGDVYVVDSDNSRLQKFHGDGTFVAEIGAAPGPGQLSSPARVAVHGSIVYVTDGAGVHLFDTAGVYQQTWALTNAQGVDVDDAGNVYVISTDFSTWTVTKFDPVGNALTSWPAETAVDLVVDATGAVDVTVVGPEYRIDRFTAGGQFLSSFGSFGSGPGQLYNEEGIGLDPSSGDVYVADTYNHRIQRFALSEFDARTVSVTKTGSGGGRVTSTPAGIDCFFDCEHTFAAGPSVALHADPNVFSSFVGWSGDCSGTTDCMVEPTFDADVTATYARHLPSGPDDVVGVAGTASTGDPTPTTRVPLDQLPISVYADRIVEHGGFVYVRDYHEIVRIDLTTGSGQRVAGSGSGGIGVPLAAGVGQDSLGVDLGWSREFAVGPDGDFYFGDESSVIYRVDSSTGFVEVVVDAGNAYTNLTVDANGSVWFLQPGALRRFDPSTGTTVTVAGDGTVAPNGSPSPLDTAATSLPLSPMFLTVTDAGVAYFVDGTGTQVVRLAGDGTYDLVVDVTDPDCAPTPGWPAASAYDWFSLGEDGDHPVHCSLDLETGTLSSAAIHAPMREYVLSTNDRSIQDQGSLFARPGGTVLFLGRSDENLWIREWQPGPLSAVVSPAPGVVSGFKLNDLNNDNGVDAGEPRVAGWTIRVFVDADADQVLDGEEIGGSTDAVTDAAGNYSVSLPAGRYLICEVRQDGWDQSPPDDVPGVGGPLVCAADPAVYAAGYTLQVAAGGHYTKNFANHQPSPPAPGVVSGFKLNDLNNDNGVDAGEPRVAGWTIRVFVDADADQVLDGEEIGGSTDAVTDAAGNYSVSLPAGRYLICEVRQDGWDQSPPDDVPGVGGPLVCAADPAVYAAGYTLQVAAGGHYTKNFANHQPSPPAPGVVSGFKLNDLNNDNGVDAGEPRVAGWTIRVFVDADADQVLDGEEIGGSTDAVTDAAGNYSVSLPAGRYLICEVRQDGWDQSPPDDVPGVGGPLVCAADPAVYAAGYTLQVAAGGHYTKNFANHQPSPPAPGVVSGFKLNDLNNDNGVDAGEPRVAGWTIRVFVDADADQVLDGEEIGGSTDAVTDAAGNYSVSLPAGRYLICEVRQDGWDQSPPDDVPGVGGPLVCAADPAVYAAGYTLQVAAGGHYTKNFANHQPSPPAPGVVSGFKLNDLNNDNGVDAGEPRVAGWTIRVFVDADADQVLDGEEIGGSTDAVTDAAGNYSVSLPAGRYLICEVRQDGWDQSPPDDVPGVGGPLVCAADPAVYAAGYTLQVAAGGHYTKNFANHQPGEAGITVVKQTEPDGDAGSFEFSASYDSNGFALADGESHFSGGLAPGTYSVAEVVPAGWKQLGATCSDGSDPAAIALDPEEQVMCTFTNARVGHITVVKHTAPAGDPQYFDFAASYDPDGFSLSDRQAEVSTDLTAGTYSVTEHPSTGWTMTDAQCSDGSEPDAIVLGPGEEVTCTFTNARLGRIEVEKQTEPAGYGGFQFTGDLTGTLSDDGLLGADVTAGTYSVTETLPASYWRVLSIVCSDADSSGTTTAATATFHIDPGETVRCVFTNRGSAFYRMRKVSVPAGGTAFPFKFDDAPLVFNLNDTDLSTTSSVAGTKTVRELAKPGWRLANVVCDSDLAVPDVATGSATYTLAPGQTATCTFTNERLGSITVVKQTVPGGDPQAFHFDASYSTTGFDLADGQSNASASLAAGTYALTEAVPDRWRQNSATCSDGSQPNAIELSPGEDITCTFNNEKLATLVVRKATLPASSDTFTFTGDVAGDVAGGGELTATVPAGAYTSIETIDSRYAVGAVACDDSDSTGDIATRTLTFRAAAGERVTCTVTNTALASVTVNKTAIGGDGTFAFSLTGQAKRSVTTAAGSGSTTWTGLAPNDYSLTEDVAALNNTYDLNPAIVCNGATTSVHSSGGKVDGVTMHVDPGATVQCSFQNVKRGHLVVVKNTPFGPSDKFRGPQPTMHFAGVPGVSDWTVGPHGGQIDVPVAPNANSAVAAGPYVVRETAAPEGWGLVTLGCADPTGDTANDLASATSTYKIDPGETVTCTYFNRPLNVDLALDVQAPTPVVYGAPFNVSLVVSNSGPDAAPNSATTLTLDTRLTLGPLPPGCSSTTTATMTTVTCQLGRVDVGTRPPIQIPVQARPCQIFGTGGDDNAIVGTDGDDVICGLGGSDRIEGRGGNDTIYGDVPGGLAAIAVVHSGTVTSSITEAKAAQKNNNDSATTNVNVPTGSGNDTVDGGPEGDTIYGQVGDDSLAGGTGSDVIYGDVGRDGLFGDLADELNLVAGASADTLWGGPDDDRLWGQGGPDTLHGEGGRDLVQGGSGDDTAYGEAGADTIDGFVGNDELHGGTDDDTIDGGNDAPGVGTSGQDKVYGEGGNDELHGGPGADGLSGGSGDDYLAGGADGDTLNGEDGVDHLLGEDGDDVLNGGAGSDKPDVSLVRLSAGLYGGTGIDTLNGNDGDDRMDGNLDNDVMDGGDGVDDMHGGENDDTIRGGRGGDKIFGDTGADKLFGEQDDDVLTGGKGNDRLDGGGGADTLAGGEGNDYLDGGAGKDVLNGGLETDTCVRVKGDSLTFCEIDA